jgi:hypothetical protein
MIFIQNKISDFIYKIHVSISFFFLEKFSISVMHYYKKLVDILARNFLNKQNGV